jgi:hypothetical protein
MYYYLVYAALHDKNKRKELSMDDMQIVSQGADAGVCAAHQEDELVHLLIFAAQSAVQGSILHKSAACNHRLHATINSDKY